MLFKALSLFLFFSVFAEEYEYPEHTISPPDSTPINNVGVFSNCAIQKDIEMVVPSGDDPENVEMYSINYDLSALRKIEGSWYETQSADRGTGQDGEDHEEDFDLYKYYFNICGDTLDVPMEEGTMQTNSWCCSYADAQHYEREGVPVGKDAFAAPGRYVADYDNSDPDTTARWVTMGGYAPAFQVKTNSDGTCECYRLGRSKNDILYGDSAETAGTMNMDLIDELNPTIGVYIEYTGGDSTPETWSVGCIKEVVNEANPDTPDKIHVNRKLKILFYCAEYAPLNNIPESIKSTTTIEEPDTCEYELIFNSYAGCPTDCQSTEVRNDPQRPDGYYLCNGKGHCEMDDGLMRPRCFCDIGWKGPKCDEQDPQEAAHGPNSCQYVGKNKYFKGNCKDGNTIFLGKLWGVSDCGTSDATTEPVSGQLEYAADGSCQNLGGLGTYMVGITCVSEDSAIFSTEPCTSSSSTTESNGNGVEAILVVVCILLILALGVIMFVAYKQNAIPDNFMKNYLSLNEQRSTSMADLSQPQPLPTSDV